MADRSAFPRQFPADIESEILLCLPVKILIRFKCACKSWYSLISSPHFQNHHFRRAQNKPPLLLTLTGKTDCLSLRFSVYNNHNEGNLTPANKFSITLPDHCCQPLMLSCRGLVCIFQGCGSIFLCNPSTRELVSLPPPKTPTFCAGFGYAPSTEDFKVVSFFLGKGETSCCQVLTLSTRRWRNGKTLPYYVFDGTAPFLHGAIHFLPWIFSGVKGTDCIGVFDIDTEDYREGIQLPTYYYSLGNCEGCRDFIRLTLLGGSLCLTFDFGRLNMLLELWLLKDYNNADWVKGYTIDVSVYPYSRDYFKAYPVDTEGDYVFLNCRDNEGVGLLGYNPQDGTVTVKKNMEWAATFFIETFYPLRSRKNMIEKFREGEMRTVDMQEIQERGFIFFWKVGFLNKDHHLSFASLK